MNSVTSAEQILDFWFGRLDSDGLANPEKMKQWWEKDAALDKQIRTRFGDLHEQAASGKLDSWRTEPRSALALLILLDQFSRNLYRDTPRMVSQDAQAVSVAQGMIEQGFDRALPIAMRSFVYLPFEHAEDLHLQNQCVELFAKMRDELDQPARAVAENSLDFAIQHQKIIERFGRFPHRNSFLGRSSTDEELAFLDQPGSSF